MSFVGRMSHGVLLRLVALLLVVMGGYDSGRFGASLEHGDRISTMSQTLHNGFKTSWIDIPIGQMPRFRVPDSGIIHVPLPSDPQSQAAGRPARVNPDEDVKISLTFADHKLILPWTVVFDAARRRSLKRLVVTFSHDQFEVEGIEYKTEYGTKIARLDPSHPAVTAFEVAYRWKGVEGEDFALGVSLMFALVLACFVGLCVFVTCTYDGRSSSSSSSSSGGSRNQSHARSKPYSSSSSLSSSSSSASAAMSYSQSPLSGNAVKRHHSGYHNRPDK